jgi:CO dehydrogenase maturation factor
MKIAIKGKGGVGKSTTVALMARLLKDRGKKVIVIDADPDMNSASLLGVPNAERIVPIRKLKELIAERTGTEVGRPAPFFTMNPKVDDIPEKYCVEHQGVKLLVMGTIQRGGGGCACPENAFLRSLLGHLIINRDEWVLLDMEAGIEHLGRGTAIGVDEMIVVVEPSKTSIETAHRIKKLSKDIGIRKLKIVGNKVQDETDSTFLIKELEDFDVLGYIDYDDAIRKMNLGQISAMEINGKPLEQIDRIIQAGDWNGQEQ